MLSWNVPSYFDTGPIISNDSDECSNSLRILQAKLLREKRCHTVPGPTYSEDF